MIEPKSSFPVVIVKEQFDAEAENDPEFKRKGWQAILIASPYITSLKK